MRIENTFEVPASPDDVWAYVLDVEKIAPCMPGAELTEVVDDKTWKGKVNVKIGPVGLSYAGTVTMDGRDDDAKRMELTAKGTETRGKGTAQAKVTATLEPSGSGTKGTLVADVTISGQAAQLARGMLGDVSQKLTGEFASCLAEAMTSLGSAGSNPAPVARPPAAAVSGGRLAMWAVLRAAARTFATVLDGLSRGLANAAERLRHVGE